MNATARTGFKAAFGRLREMDRAVSLTGLNPKKAAATLKLAGAEESRCAQWGKVFLRSVRWPERAFGVLSMSFHFAWMALPFTRFMYPTNWLTSALPGSEWGGDWLLWALFHFVIAPVFYFGVFTLIAKHYYARTLRACILGHLCLCCRYPYLAKSTDGPIVVCPECGQEMPVYAYADVLHP